MTKRSNNSLPIALSVATPEVSGSLTAHFVDESTTISRQSPCLSRKTRQDNIGLAAAIPVLPRARHTSLDDEREKRRWLVRLLARRAVAILKAQEQGQ
jgi:hypothetical protein